jgi:peroxiredoxin Q/BCP
VNVLNALRQLFGRAPKREPLAVGSPVPALIAPDENGQPLDLSAVCARGLVLVYFYPMANTPGCTAQACSLRDGITELENVGVTVIGVSHETPASQKAFKEKYRLPFTLLADREGKVIKAFGVPTIAFGIPKRQSFLFKDGKLAWRSLSAETKHHAEEVRQAAAALAPEKA